MSNCSVCGSVEYWHADGEGTMAKPTCHKCLPPTVTILPPDGEGAHSHKYDIEETEVMPANGATGSCPPAISFDGDPNTGIVSSGPPISFKSGGTSTLKIADPPADFEIHGADGKATTLSVDGSKVIVAYDELPATASQGQMAVRKGEDITYVFDGEEWQNLGEALLGKKRSTLTPRDKKINRRAAVAATKAKDGK